MSIFIRPVKAEDCEQLWNLICDLAAFQGSPGVVKATPAVLQQQIESPNPPFECLVAELSGRLVGFALFFHSYSTWEGQSGIYLEDFYVVPEMRRSGVGKLLLSQLAQLAIERGLTRMDWIALRSNSTALRFYEHLGASPLPDLIHWRLDYKDLARISNLQSNMSQKASPVFSRKTTSASRNLPRSALWTNLY